MIAELCLCILLTLLPTKNTSYGVLIVPQDISIAEAIDNIILIWLASDVEEWINRIIYLPL